MANSAGCELANVENTFGGFTPCAVWAVGAMGKEVV